MSKNKQEFVPSAERRKAKRKETKMNGKYITLALFGVALMLFPLLDVNEVEWFPPDISREIAKSSEVKNSENAAQPQRDTFLKFRAVSDGVHEIVNDQVDR